jgi:hypothetical protein
MSRKKFTFVAILAAASALPALAFATPAASPHGAHCLLTEHRVTAVQPLRVTERNGRGSSERLAGAQVFVQAEPGLTAEWLQLTIQRHIAQMSGMASCPLDVKDVRVTVQSAGPGFAVQITGKNAAQAKEILRRAQLLVP